MCKGCRVGVHGVVTYRAVRVFRFSEPTHRRRACLKAQWEIWSETSWKGKTRWCLRTESQTQGRPSLFQVCGDYFPQTARLEVFYYNPEGHGFESWKNHRHGCPEDVGKLGYSFTSDLDCVTEVDVCVCFCLRPRTWRRCPTALLKHDLQHSGGSDLHPDQCEASPLPGRPEAQ